MVRPYGKTGYGSELEKKIRIQPDDPKFSPKHTYILHPARLVFGKDPDPNWFSYTEKWTRLLGHSKQTTKTLRSHIKHKRKF